MNIVIPSPIQNTITIRVAKQTEAQIANPNTYMYVRKAVLCNSIYKRAWISQIKPIQARILPYNVSKLDAVNTNQPGTCLKLRNLYDTSQGLYDVDILFTTDEYSVSVSSNDDSFFTIQNTIVIAVIGCIMLASITIFVVTTKRKRAMNKRLIKGTHLVNPLNTIPVVVPWTNTTQHWKLGDTLSHDREQFPPSTVRH